MDDLTELLQKDLPLLRKGNYSNASEFFRAIFDKNGWHLEEAVAAEKWLDALDYACDLAENNHIVREALCEEFGFNPSGDSGQFQDFAKKVSDLFDEITSKKDALKKLQEPVAPPANLTYMPIEIKSFKQLDFFEKVHEAIEDDRSFEDPNEVASLLESLSFDTLKEFSALTKKIYLDIFCQSSQNFPSIIICASSGMGKTQIPFSLDIPLLYFTLVTTAQPIYQQFSIISDYFVSILQADFDDYCSSLKRSNNNEKYDPLDDLENFSLEKLRKSSCELRTPYFLLELTKNIFRMKLDEPSAKWPRLELRMMKTIGPEKIKPAVAFKEFNNLATKGMSEFETRTAEELKIITLFSSQDERVFRLPVIFIDEFNVNKKSENYLPSRYAFYRNLIRSCGLTPVLMGTNSKITNLVTTAANQSGDSTNLWAYVFHKMPPFPRDNLKEKLSAFIPIGNDLFQPIYEILKNERPFFIHKVLETLQKKALDYFCGEKFSAEQFTSDLLYPQDSFARFFNLILEAIQMEFLKRKSLNLPAFSKYQIGFLDYAYNVAHYEEESNVPPESINCHLANLRGHPNGNVLLKDGSLNLNETQPKSFFELYRIGYKISYYERNAEGKVGYFVPYCFQHEFYETPLSCMAFSKDKVFFPMISKDQSAIVESHTAFEAFSDLKLDLSIAGAQNQNIDKFVGKNLESIVNLAFVIACNRNGILGTPFPQWLNLFIQQLACFPFESDQVKFSGKSTDETSQAIIPIKIPQNEKEKFEHRIPITTFNNSKWNKHLKKLFKGFGIPMLTFSGAAYKSVDLSATVVASDNQPGPESKSIDLSEAVVPSNVQPDSESSVPVEITLTTQICDEEPPLETESEIMQKVPSKRKSKTSKKADLASSEPKSLISIECKLRENNTSPSQIWTILAKMIRGKTLGKINIIVARKFSKDSLFEKTSPTATQLISLPALKASTDGKKSESQPTEPVKVDLGEFDIYWLKRNPREPGEKVKNESCCYDSKKYGFELKKLLNDEVSETKILRKTAKRDIADDENRKKILILVSLDEIHGIHWEDSSYLLKF